MSSHTPQNHASILALRQLSPLREVIESYGLAARKSLGQNFILDLNLTCKIARASGSFAGQTVVEIGPGPGGLTRALLMEGAERVIAIEKDHRCLPALEEIQAASAGKLQIVQGDAMTAHLPAYGQEKPVKVVANLPYNIATPLLIGWLTQNAQAPYLSSLTLMFQKEVAQRIVAAPGERAYGRLSVICQYLCDCKLLFTVSRNAFTPPPKVESAIVHLQPFHSAGEHTDSGVPDLPVSIEALEQVTAAAFGQRRKMLRSSLRNILPDTPNSLKKLGIDPTARAETLSVEKFTLLADLISRAC